MSTSHTFVGASGAEYPYEIFSVEDALDAVVGNYIVLGRWMGGDYSPIYADESSDIKGAVTGNHESWGCFLENRMTHVAVHIDADDNPQVRQGEVSDLIAGLRPTCN